MSAPSDERSHTTLWVSKELAGRLNELKPYDSMSYGEFLAEMADVYQDVVLATEAPSDTD